MTTQSCHECRLPTRRPSLLAPARSARTAWWWAYCDAFVLVTLTGGEAVTTGDGGELRVPKRDLASCVQVLLQSERLRIGRNLSHATTLTDELVNFKVKTSLTGHDSYGAGSDWRKGNHDDLVLALALACWYGENRTPIDLAAFYRGLVTP
jgi:hypothetical protein